MTDQMIRVLALRISAAAVLKDMECDHRDSEYGACFDCRNTGYAISCQQEADLVDACCLILRATDELVSGAPMTDSEPKPVFWSISEPFLLAMLRRVEAGETADDVYAEQYVNATIETIPGTDDEGEHR